MWSVVLVNQSGSIVDVLSDGERELSGATAFAAGYGQPAAGAVVVIPTSALQSDPVSSVEETSLPTGDINFNEWLLNAADKIEFNTLTVVGMVCGAMRAHVVHHFEGQGIERESCLDRFEVAMGEMVADAADDYPALRLNDAADWPQLGPNFRKWLVEVASNVALDSLTVVGLVCGAMRAHVVRHFEGQGIERESCMDSFEWSMSGEQSIEDPIIREVLAIRPKLSSGFGSMVNESQLVA
jgi:hypothetical protein